MPRTKAQASTKRYNPRTHSRRTRARFTADRTRALVLHLGRPPSYPESLIISRVVSLEWWLIGLDRRLDDGAELSGHSIRGRLAAETRLRLDLATIGIRPQPKAEPSLADWNADAKAAAVAG